MFSHHFLSRIQFYGPRVVLLKKSFISSAQYLLTEVSHGLDALNLETTATLLPDGGFDLHTPNDGAAK